ncbi:cell adhesion molecule CEACAM1-like [Trachinotus anak]|uniref:cell adhesion molecule CEACAM1-like n=1 Tax=Trachinotus anak TaxID=443729 RepID=UPI0039F19651
METIAPLKRGRTTDELLCYEHMMIYKELTFHFLLMCCSASPVRTCGHGGTGCEHSYSEVGGTLVLTPPFSGRINHILWKHGANLAAEWLNGELDYYGMFRGCTTLDTTTGQLEIKDMTESYAGLYTVEINNKLQSQGYNVEVIKRLSKPEVVQRPLTCSTVSDSCTLSCDGDTTGAGPVTYSWNKDDGQWVQEEKDKTIMNNEETKSIKTFSCQMKNPVIVKESDPHQNPFFPVPGSVSTEHYHIYSEVGGTLVLTPPSSGHINHILWKHGANLAAEWYIGELDYYGMFRGCTTLDTTTGGLEIKDMTESYAGLYTVEINNRPQSQGYNVEVINRLSKPEVVQRPLSCSTASDSCTLSCDGDTTGAGPVTYSWKKDGQWVQEEKDKTIMNNEETKRIKTFSCQMKNPVSVEESDPHQNPFFQEESLGP